MRVLLSVDLKGSISLPQPALALINEWSIYLGNLSWRSFQVPFELFSLHVPSCSWDDVQDFLPPSFNDVLNSSAIISNSEGRWGGSMQVWSDFEHTLSGTRLNLSFCFLSYPIWPLLLFNRTHRNKSLVCLWAERIHKDHVILWCQTTLYFWLDSFSGWTPETRKVRG